MAEQGNPVQADGTQTAGTTQNGGKQPPASLFQVPSEEQIKELQSIIPPIVAARFPDIIKMLYETPSLSFEEKKYWLQLLPLMSNDQVEKLRGILTNEKTQLTELNEEYETALEKVGLRETKEMKEKKERQQRVKQEQVHEKEEQVAEEELLQELSDM